LKRLPEKHPQGFPSTTTQFQKEWTIVEERTSKDFGDAEDKMTIGTLRFAFGTLKLVDQAPLVLLDKKGNYGHQDDKKTTAEIQGQE
jgi:hypothetical protein